MRSRLEVRVHVNRALRAGTAEQKLNEIALAIGELARYVEEIEKDGLRRSLTRADQPALPNRSSSRSSKA